MNNVERSSLDGNGGGLVHFIFAVGGLQDLCFLVFGEKVLAWGVEREMSVP